MNDLGFALRQLAKSPGFTAVVVLSLALGIGANATVLCWLQNLVLRPMPGVRNQEELVVVVSNQGGGPSPRSICRTSRTSSRSSLARLRRKPLRPP